MAPRTATKRLLAPRAKLTSAGVIPALVIAALLAVSGCGGGSDAQTASAPSSQATTGSASSTPGGDGSGASGSSNASGPSDSSSSSGSSSPSSPSNSAAGKQGPHVKPPKGPREPEPTPAEKAEATVADIALSSPALQSAAGSEEASLPATYTCDGNDSWPALRWQGVPAATQELLLFAMNIQPVEGKLFFDWAVAGLDPSLDEIEAGQLPKGAVVGQNSFGKTGYSICPPGSAETYVFALYALPKTLSSRQGFDPHALREEVLAASGNVGLMAASYAR